MGCSYAKLQQDQAKRAHGSDSGSVMKRNGSRKSSLESIARSHRTSASSMTVESSSNDDFHMPVIILRNERVVMDKLSKENPLPSWLKKLKSFDSTDEKRQTRAYVSPLSRCTTLEEVMAAADVVEPVFLDEVDQLCEVRGIKPMLTSKITEDFCTLKDGVRAQEKAMDRYDGDFSRLFDVLRASIICSDYASLLTAWTRLNSNSHSWKVLRLKNRFLNPSLTGYRDLLVTVELETEGVVHLCELQMHLEVFERASTFTYHYFRRVSTKVAQEFRLLSQTRFLELTYASSLRGENSSRSRESRQKTAITSGLVPTTPSVNSDPQSLKEMQLIRSVVESVEPADLRSLLAMIEESNGDDVPIHSYKLGLDEASLSTHDASSSQMTH